MVGALYGLLTGTAFVLMSAFIDVLLHPDLPLGVDWTLMSTRWILIGLGLALIGAADLPVQRNMGGLLAGAIAAGLPRIDQCIVSFPHHVGVKSDGAVLFTLAPIAVMSLPIAWILRRLAERHALALYSERPLHALLC